MTVKSDVTNKKENDHFTNIIVGVVTAIFDGESGADCGDARSRKTNISIRWPSFGFADGDMPSQEHKRILIILSARSRIVPTTKTTSTLIVIVHVHEEVSQTFTQDSRCRRR